MARRRGSRENPPGSEAPVRVMLTREAGRNEELAQRLELSGLEPVVLPLTRTAPPEDGAPLRRVAREADRFDWIVFASARAVEAFAAARPAARRPLLAMFAGRVAAVGSATAAAVRRAGGKVDFVPNDSRAGGLVAEWPGDPRGARILLPRAEKGRTELARSLRARGARVREVVAYRTVRAPVPRAVLRRIAAGEIAIVVFQAPSAVAALAAAARAAGVPVAGRFAAVAIGPTTAAPLRRLRPTAIVVAERPSDEGLVEAVARAAAGPRPAGGLNSKR